MNIHRDYHSFYGTVRHSKGCRMRCCSDAAEWLMVDACSIDWHNVLLFISALDFQIGTVFY